MISDYLFLKIFKLPQNSSLIILNGGLGNQLFQYFLGEELRITLNKNVFYYDIREHYKNSHDTFIENIFKVNLQKYKPHKNVFVVKKFLISPFFLKLNKFLVSILNFGLIPNFYSDSGKYSAEFISLQFKNAFGIYFGTWHKYINSYKFLNENLIQDFKGSKNIFHDFNFKNDFIALHIRRGDYISSKRTAKYHGNLEKEYFLQSVDYLRNKFLNLPVLLFSDDHKWLHSEMKSLIPNSFVFSSQDFSAESDLFYMTKAKYFILSNSTFSWWAAFLSKEKNKFIVIPKYWFKNVETSKNFIYKNWSYKII